MKAFVIVVLFGLVAWPSVSHGHEPSDGHLRLAVTAEGIEGRLELAVRDIDGAIILDSNGDGAVTWGELADASPRIDSYISDRLTLGRGASPCVLALASAGLVENSSGPYWSVPFSATCAGTSNHVAITYRVMFDSNALHRALVRIEAPHERTLIIRDAKPVDIELGEGTSIGEFIIEGICHIWKGLDHMLFLTCLILPAVYARRGQPSRSFRASAISVVQIVTAFTIAHSVTLVLSTLGIISLPSRLVETAIALSVVAAAINNIVRIVDARWLLAFVLGLLHGFGFSSVLVDIGVPARELLTALAGFNIGVELGQLAFVIVLLPLLYLLRRTVAYRVLLWGGSAGVAVLATLWTYQRLTQ